MILNIWRLAPLGALIIGSASTATSSQKVLGGLDSASRIQESGFGVGFDLTTPYGHEKRSHLDYGSETLTNRAARPP